LVTIKKQKNIYQLISNINNLVIIIIIPKRNSSSLFDSIFVKHRELKFYLFLSLSFSGYISKRKKNINEI